MQRPEKPHRLVQACVVALCIGLVLFPKGGVRVGGIPLTWGYLALGICNLIAIPYRATRLHGVFVRRQIVALLTLVPWLWIVGYSYFGVGMLGYVGYAGIISTVVSLTYFPLLFLWFFAPMLRLVDGDTLARWLRWCMLAAAIFGIFQFVYRPLRGHFIEVPYLTMNGNDSADLEHTKMISRGSLFKLISTYNNGNIYGIATLILLPLFDRISTRKWQGWVMRLAVALTLSRTVWAGLLFEQLLSLGSLLARQRHSFPVLRLRQGRVRIILLVGAILFFILLVTIAGYGRRFLLDPSLGGRAASFDWITNASWFPERRQDFLFSEIVYVSALAFFGYAGLLSMMLILLGPFLVLLFDVRALRDPYRRAALKGLALYNLISLSDGAIGLIPVMAFFWFAYMIFLFGWPAGLASQQEAQPVVTRRRFRLLPARTTTGAAA